MKISRIIKILIVVVIVLALGWFFVLNPKITFKNYEKEMIEAAQTFVEQNSNEAPTGTRVKTITLQELYYKSYLKNDFYIPNTSKPCSLVDSWVKIKKDKDDYKYYTYLKCGSLESKIDHTGPEIKLKGKNKITVTKGDKFSDPGIESIKDNSDGKIDVKSATVRGEVDTSKIGNYEITYVAYDKLNNKSEVKRKVEVVERLKSTIMDKTDKKGYYTGGNPDNYIMFSNMLFRIVGLQGDNVVIVSDEDIANVDYNGINKWLDDYFYKHLSNGAKKLIVDSKYCNMSSNDQEIVTLNKCSRYTSERKIYIPSALEVNRAEDETGNFMKPTTISWISQAFDTEKAYVTRRFFLDIHSSKQYMTFSKDYNLGVRPMLTIKGNILLKSGDGSKNSPYTLGENKTAKADDLLNTRNTGEYINLSDMLWRIVEVNKDGTTKIISMDTLSDGIDDIETTYNIDDDVKIYNPKEKGNVGYFINNKASKYIDTKFFVNRDMEVPIYNDEIKYESKKTLKKYKVKLIAPSMYEMFSAFSDKDVEMGSYWFRDSSKNKDYFAVQTQVGVVSTDVIGYYDRYGIRIVGNLEKNMAIVSGKGTIDSPFVIFN